MRIEFNARVLRAVVALGALCVLGTPFGASADDGPFSAVKAAAERNQAQLRHYSWISTTQVSYDGNVKNTKVESVSYGLDGAQQKKLVSQTEAPKPPGLRGALAERKGEEITARTRERCRADPQLRAAESTTTAELPSRPAT